jgi:hypothetical protein
MNFVAGSSFVCTLHSPLSLFFLHSPLSLFWFALPLEPFFLCGTFLPTKTVVLPSKCYTAQTSRLTSLYVQDTVTGSGFTLGQPLSLFCCFLHSPLSFFFFSLLPDQGSNPGPPYSGHALCCHPPRGPQHPSMPLCPSAPLDWPGFTSGTWEQLNRHGTALPLEPFCSPSTSSLCFDGLDSFPHPNPFCKSSHTLSVLYWDHA